MLVGLVELNVDLSGLRPVVGYRSFNYVRAGIERAVKDRTELVVAALKAAGDGGCELIVFPGWTIVAHDIPKSIRALSKGRTVVIERLEPGASSREGSGGYCWWTYALHNGQEVASAQQVLSHSTELFNAGHLKLLADQLAPGTSRRFHLASKSALLMVCGEVNLIKGGGPAKYATHVFSNSVPNAALQGKQVILNPSHTPARLPAMNDKRCWLSQGGGWVLTTANIFSATPAGQVALKAAQAWYNGVVKPIAAGPVGSGYAVKTLRLP